MNDLNTSLLEGRLVRDPELAYTSKEQPLCTFAIAVNRYFRQDEDLRHEVSYFEIVVWGKRAETCGSILKKGRGVRVCGRLKQDRWTDESGNINKKIRIIADYVEFKPETKTKTDSSSMDTAEHNEEFSDIQLSENANSFSEHESLLEPEESSELVTSQS